MYNMSCFGSLYTFGKFHGDPDTKGGFSRYSQGGFMGLFFGDTRHQIETFCEVSACPYFFPTKNLQHPD